MSMNKNIARLAVTAGLTAALSFGGVMAPVTMAFAEGVPTVAQSGNVTITDSTYTDTTFKGIQIFKAKVTQNKDGNTWSGEKTLSDVEWASNAVKDAVTGRLPAAPPIPKSLPVPMLKSGLNGLMRKPKLSTLLVQTRTLSLTPERPSTRSPRHWRKPISLRGRMAGTRATMASSLA